MSIGSGRTLINECIASGMTLINECIGSGKTIINEVCQKWESVINEIHPVLSAVTKYYADTFLLVVQYLFFKFIINQKWGRLFFFGRS